MISYFKTYRAKDWVALVIVSFVLAVCAVVGTSYYNGQGEPSLSLQDTALQIYVATVALALFAFLVNFVLDLLTRKKGDAEGGSPEATNPENATDVSTTTGSENSSGNQASTNPAPSTSCARKKLTAVFETLTPKFNVKSIAIFSIVMLLLWTPWIIAFFPAPFNVDLFYQIYQFTTDGNNWIIPFGGKDQNVQVDAWLVDHHPFVTTLFYGFFGWASERLAGNWEAGIFLCSLLHAIAFVIVYSASIAFLRKSGCPAGLCLAIWLFFALMPFVVVWSISLTKDSTFSLFLILYLMMIFEAYRSDGRLFARRRNIVLFILCSLALCLTKKTGVYLVIVVAVALVWRFRPKKAESKLPVRVFAGSAAISAIVMFVLIPLIVFPLLSIHPGGKQEPLGLPFQQTARYIVEYEEDVTPEEREAIDKVLVYDNLKEKYYAKIHDEVKFQYRQDSSTADLLGYLGAYISMGIKHPDAYFNAFMGAADFFMSYSSTLVITPSGYTDYAKSIAYTANDNPEGEPLVVWAPAELADMRLGMERAYYAISQIPGLNFLLLVALYTLWIPAALLLFMLRRGLPIKVILLPGLIMLMFCLISPMGATRYTIAIFDTAMLVVGIVVTLARCYVAGCSRV